MHGTDTDADARRIHDELVLRLSPAERRSRALAWSEEARAIALEALRRRDPDASLLKLVERLTNEPMHPGVRAGPVPHA